VIEVFLDETPGETRGVVVRGGRAEHLLMQRDGDAATHRLGARSIGRVAEVVAALRGTFVDLADGSGFLPTKAEGEVRVGEKVEVVVTAEPRGGKGPTLRRLGAGEGELRLLAVGPTVAERLATLAPGIAVQIGAAAIAAGDEAVEEARGGRVVVGELGLDVAVQRTRALIAVDLDFTGAVGGDGRKARAWANDEGLRQAARLIRLNGWGGLVAIDLIGAGFDGKRIMETARAAFDDPLAVLGPVSRFGVLELSLPWRMTPLDERSVAVEARAIVIVRALRAAMLDDTTVARVVAHVSPGDLKGVMPLVARLGPRAGAVADPALRPGAFEIRRD
jgi:hypothetical protein